MFPVLKLIKYTHISCIQRAINLLSRPGGRWTAKNLSRRRASAYIKYSFQLIGTALTVINTDCTFGSVLLLPTISCDN